MLPSLHTKVKGNLFLLCIILGFTSNTYAQDQDSTKLDSTKQKSVDSAYFVEQTSSIRLSLIPTILTFQYENPIGPKTVFDVNAGLLFSLGFSKLSIDINQEGGVDANARYFALMPHLSAGVKHFYNIERRLKKGKSILNNSANYFGGRLYGAMLGWNKETNIFNEEKSKRTQFSSKSAVGLVAMWGMNRNLGNNFNFNLEVGPSLVYNLDSEIVPSFWLNVGFSKTF